LPRDRLLAKGGVAKHVHKLPVGKPGSSNAIDDGAAKIRVGVLAPMPRLTRTEPIEVKVDVLGAGGGFVEGSQEVEADVVRG
jgi:hypothetical protein